MRQQFALNSTGVAVPTPNPLAQTLVSTPDGRIHVTTDGLAFRVIYGLQWSDHGDYMDALNEFSNNLAHAIECGDLGHL